MISSNHSVEVVPVCGGGDRVQSSMEKSARLMQDLSAVNHLHRDMARSKS